MKRLQVPSMQCLRQKAEDGPKKWSFIMENVRSGVPQGSILGPLLVLLYVNDLPDSVKATAKMFADDKKIY